MTPHSAVTGFTPSAEPALSGSHNGDKAAQLEWV